MPLEEMKSWRQKGYRKFYADGKYSVNFTSGEAHLVTDDPVPMLLDASTSGPKAGMIGDGKILVYSVDEIVRIRTGEGRDAISYVIDDVIGRCDFESGSTGTELRAQTNVPGRHQ